MIHGKSVLAFIPAKTGSVGLPGKLFKEVGGYSLLEWTLLAAYKSNYIDEIVVSSNDPLIEKVVKEFPFKACTEFKLELTKVLKFVERPDSLCTPTSKTEDAILHFFNTYIPYTRNYDYLVTLQATSPARRNGLIDKCFNELAEFTAYFSRQGSLITVEESTPFFWKYSELCSAYPTYSLMNRPMRQQLTSLDMMYKDNGNIYITDVASFLSKGIRISGNVCLYKTSKFESLQIDDIEDFIMMESLYKHYGSFL